MTTLAVAEQRDRSLRLANLYRHERSRTRAWLCEPREAAESRERCAQLLLGDPLAHLATLPILDLLTWCRWTDRRRARAMLVAAGVSEFKHVGQLTVRQQLGLAGQLRHGHYDQPSLPGSGAS